MDETLTVAGIPAANSRRLLHLLLLLPLAVGLVACSADENGDPCALEDQAGIIGGTDVFVVRVPTPLSSPSSLRLRTSPT
jgi:hypothetical protein